MQRSRPVPAWAVLLEVFATLAVLTVLSMTGCDQHAGERPRPSPETKSSVGTGGAPTVTATAPPAPTLALWNPEQIEWHDFEAGMALSRSTLRPVCLVFTADWCPHCKRYARVFASPTIAAAAKRFVMIRVDVDANEDVSTRYSPDGGYIPRTVFLDPEGKLADVHAPRTSSKYFYDENDPSSLLTGMRAAYELLAVGAPGSF